MNINSDSDIDIITRRDIYHVYITTRRFSLRGYITSLLAIAWYQIKNSIPSRINICGRVLPMQRYQAIQTLNTSLVLWMIQVIFNRQKIEIVWINNPTYYAIHNRISWNTLVFDYNMKAPYVNRLFYTQVFQKRVVYLYIRTKTPSTLQCLSVKGDTQNRYKQRITRLLIKFGVHIPD